MQSDLQHAAARLVHDYMDDTGLRLDAVIQHNAAGHLDDLLLSGAGVDRYAVQFADTAGRVGQHIDKGTVIGHEQQPFAVLVKTAHGAQHGGHIGHQLHDGLAAAVIRAGGQIAARLVQHDVGVLALAHDADGLAVDHDFVVVWGPSCAPQGDGVAVDLDLARCDQALRLTAGADALISQYIFALCILPFNILLIQRAYQRPAFSFFDQCGDLVDQLRQGGNHIVHGGDLLHQLDGAHIAVGDNEERDRRDRDACAAAAAEHLLAGGRPYIGAAGCKAEGDAGNGNDGGIIDMDGVADDGL